MPSKQTVFVKNFALKNSRLKEEKNTRINDVNTINKEEEEKNVWSMRRHCNNKAVSPLTPCCLTHAQPLASEPVIKCFNNIHN